jgi:mono/diheme cytochrome c family protein
MPTKRIKKDGWLSILMLFLIGTCFGWTSSDSQDVVLYQKPVAQKVKQQKTTPETGKIIYQKYCLTCHQNDGSGVPNTFPPLIKSSWVNGDKATLIKIVLNGLTGEINVNDDYYNGVMPKQSNLTDNQIALVLTFLRQNFGNASKAILPKEVKALRGK